MGRVSFHRTLLRDKPYILQRDIRKHEIHDKIFPEVYMTKGEKNMAIEVKIPELTQIFQELKEINKHLENIEKRVGR